MRCISTAAGTPALPPPLRVASTGTAKPVAVLPVASTGTAKPVAKPAGPGVHFRREGSSLDEDPEVGP